MSIRKQPASRTPADAYATSRDAAALPLVLELAVLLESVAVLVPDGATRLPEVGASIFSKPALFSQGTEARSTGDIIDELFRSGYPVLLRSWAPNVPECCTFVVDEDGLAQWLRRWARDDAAREPQPGRGLAARADELQTALTRRLRRWAGSDREGYPGHEWTHGDALPEGLDSFLLRYARNLAVDVAADERGHVTLRLRW